MMPYPVFLLFTLVIVSLLTLAANAQTDDKQAKQVTALAAAKKDSLTRENKNTHTFYWVKDNDTLYSVAKNNQINVQTLAQWNYISPPYQIRLGQKLVLVAPSTSTNPVQLKKNNATASDKTKTVITKTSASKLPLDTKNTAVNSKPIIITPLPTHTLSSLQPLDISGAVKELPTTTSSIANNLPEVKATPQTKAVSIKPTVSTPNTALSTAKSTKQVSKAPENSIAKPKPIMIATAKQAQSGTSNFDKLSNKEIKQKANHEPIEEKNSPKKPVLLAANSSSQTVQSTAPVTKPTDKSTTVNSNEQTVANLLKMSANLNFQMPIQGDIIKNFKATGEKGIEIGVQQNNQAVHAAEAGKIVYMGQGMVDFKNLIIINHNTAFLSAYANNTRLLAQEGQFVRKGEIIAEIDTTDNEHKPLHFEIRRGGHPINPLSLLRLNKKN